MVNNKLSIKLGEKRKKLSKVSEETGLSRGTLTALYYNSSKAISFNTLDKLCEYFQCDIGDLLYRED